MRIPKRERIIIQRLPTLYEKKTLNCFKHTFATHRRTDDRFKLTTSCIVFSSRLDVEDRDEAGEYKDSKQGHPRSQGGLNSETGHSKDCWSEESGHLEAWQRLHRNNKDRDEQAVSCAPTTEDAAEDTRVVLVRQDWKQGISFFQN